MIKFSGAIALLFCGLAAAAQTSGNFSPNTNVQRDFSGKAVQATPAPGEAVAESRAAEYLQSLLATPGLELRLLRRETDQIGMVHLRYGLLFNGTLMANKLVIAHFKNGLLSSVNGDLEYTSAPANDFLISESTALQAALVKVGAEKYKWQNEAETHHMRQALNNPSFSYYPKGEKVWLEKNGSLYAAWKFNIYAEQPLYRSNVFVDAGSGTVLDEQNLICTADLPGSAVTKYSGTQTITVNQPNISQQVYRLRQSSFGQGVETYNLQNGSNYGSAVDFTNSTTSWTTTGFDQGATDAHWGAERTYDYYWSQHSRNSIDGFGMKLLSYVHYNTNFSNAFWDGQRMTYGDGNGGSMRIFSALDVCGHEITHGLTDMTSGLIYQNQSGALNESFSDIFGVAIENFSRPANWNWRIGEDITSSGIGLRNMSNPNSFGDPDTYLGTNWYSGTADNGGVHTNSGVPNYWFYLLVTGGTGVNDLSKSYSIQGLGMQTAARIAFRALTVYFTSSTDFAAARIACIQAAKDLYGDCSNELIQTANAWYAVGVGAQILPNSVGPNFTANVLNFCSVPATVNFSNTTPYAQSYVWNFGDGGTSSAVNPVHTYTTAGNYTIKLKANGCNNTDSLQKVAYVVVDVPGAPAVTGSSHCYGDAGVLFASANGLLRWYDSPASTFSLQAGTTFNVPTVTANTTYYVNNTYTSAPTFGGILLAGGGGYTNNQQYLIFDVFQNCVLNTVVIYAQTAGGTRTIELRNGAFNLLASQVVQLPLAGANTVTLDFAISPGSNYILALGGSTAGNLYRTNTNVNYPYNIGGCVSIKGSSAGSSAYYWFYNWKVTRADCVSPMSAVTASVLPAPSVNVGVSSEIVCVDDLVPVTMSPPGGTLTGSGIQGSNFSALQVGPGSHLVSYTYADPNGCENTAQVTMVAQECTGINETGKAVLQMYPNPASNAVYLDGVSERALVTLHDSNGRLVKQVSGAQAREIGIAELASGLYLVSVYENGQNLGSLRLVKD
jgi:Zn-dependent metalloprotease